MTNDEKQAVLQLMGIAYGDAHKQDQMIVSKSGQLQPNSHIMKERFEEVLRTPTEQPQHNAPAPAPQQEPVASSPEQEPQQQPVQVVDVQQAAQELAMTEAETAAPAPAPAPAADPDQLEFNLSEPSKLDKLIDLVRDQNLLLKQISLKLDNGKRAKVAKKG
tara:strand:- start:2477 stop:2962 length:486 start_codon:yes stop_codon:yes gene_type:complete